MKGKKTGGRKKGVPNKLTKDAREAWEAAIEHAQGTAGMSMADWATRDAESNQRFWVATISAMPKAVDVTTLGKALSGVVVLPPAK